MDSISRVNQVIETLRRQIAESARQLDSTPTQRTAGQRPAKELPGLVSLRAGIQEKIRGLDAADPQRNRRARRAFLESVLAWELGDELLLDQRFADMLDHIEVAMKSNPELDRRFDQMILELSAQPADRQ